MNPARMGRPRPQETIARDRLILTLLSDRTPRSKNQIADMLGIPRHQTYLALCRLRDDGKVTRPDVTGQRYLWTVP